MRNQFHLYWSNIEAYEACPRSFLWSHGWGTIDLGRGPGRSKLKPEQDSEHHAVMGIVLSSVIQHLYNDELWRDPPTLPDRITEIVNREFTLVLGEKKVDWAKAPPRYEMLEVCLKGSMGYLKTMKANRLLGPYAKSEVDLTAWVDQYTPIAGRPDIIIRRDDTGVMILDGKNSLSPGKYTNPDQLRWYALCFFLAYSVMPSRLAFCYFRYPDGSPPRDHPEGQPWTGLVDVLFNRDDMRALGVRAKETHRSMQKELFDPRPSPKNCRFCDYRAVCDVAHQPSSRKSKDLTLEEGTIEHAISISDGMLDLGLGQFSGVTSKP